MRTKCRLSGVERSQQVGHLNQVEIPSADAAGTVFQSVNNAILQLFSVAVGMCRCVVLQRQFGLPALHSGNRELSGCFVSGGWHACNTSDSRYDSRGSRIFSLSMTPQRPENGT